MIYAAEEVYRWFVGRAKLLLRCYITCYMLVQRRCTAGWWDCLWRPSLWTFWACLARTTAAARPASSPSTVSQRQGLHQDYIRIRIEAACVHVRSIQSVRCPCMSGYVPADIIWALTARPAVHNAYTLPALQEKRLGAGLIDGRAVWADGGQAARMLDALRTALGPDQCICLQVGHNCGWGSCASMLDYSARGLCSWDSWGAWGLCRIKRVVSLGAHSPGVHT